MPADSTYTLGYRLILQITTVNIATARELVYYLQA